MYLHFPNREAGIVVRARLWVIGSRGLPLATTPYRWAFGQDYLLILLRS